MIEECGRIFFKNRKKIRELKEENRRLKEKNNALTIQINSDGNSFIRLEQLCDWIGASIRGIPASLYVRKLTKEESELMLFNALYKRFRKMDSEHQKLKRKYDELLIELQKDFGDRTSLMKFLRDINDK